MVWSYPRTSGASYVTAIRTVDKTVSATGSATDLDTGTLALAQAAFNQGIFGRTGGRFFYTKLESVDGDNPGTPTDLGTVPSDVASLQLFAGLTSARLGVAASTNTGSSSTSSQTDIFFVQGGKAGSLARVTNTTAKDETPVSFF